MNALFLAYHSLSEPIMESQGISYMRKLAKEGVDYWLLTFEPREKITDSKKIITGMDFRLNWKYLIYHGRPRLLATLYDIAAGILSTACIIKKRKIKLVHARGFIPGLIGFLPARLLGAKFFFDTRGLLADKYVCGGLVDEKSITYNAMRFFEDFLVNNSDFFTVETEAHAKVISGSLNKSPEKLKKVISKMAIIPCCIDTDKFNYDNFPRKRSNLNFIFLGKLGTWYCLNEMLDFFNHASKEFKDLNFTFITESSSEEIYRTARAKNINESRIIVRNASPKQVSGMLNTAGASIIFMNSCKQYGFCPIKFGESLACGLPVIVTSGIGDCDKIIEKEKVGVIIKDFSQQEYTKAVINLAGLFREGDALRLRCREAAKKYLSLDAGSGQYRDIYKRLDN